MRAHPPQPSGDSVALPTASASALTDGLLRMAHCLIMELPEPELREVRATLDILTMKIDHILDSTEYDLSLNFDGLNINPGIHRHQSSEDFGAILVSTSVSTTSDIESTSGSSSHRHTTINRVPVPTRSPSPDPIHPTPAPTPVPTVPTHGIFPYVISSRTDVGIPDYTYHPLFIRPGVPGPYHHPPSQSRSAHHDGYFVVTRGLYVGVFSNWHEAGSYVTGVSRSLHNKTKTWEQARDLYNTRLAAGAVRVLP